MYEIYLYDPTSKQVFDSLHKDEDTIPENLLDATNAIYFFGFVSQDVYPEDASVVFDVTFDNTNPNWHNDMAYNELFVKQVMNHATAALTARGHVFLNDVLGFLDIPRIPVGQLEGWISSDSNFIAWSSENNSNGSVTIHFETDGVIYNKI